MNDKHFQKLRVLISRAPKIKIKINHSKNLEQRRSSPRKFVKLKNKSGIWSRKKLKFKVGLIGVQEPKRECLVCEWFSWFLREK
jgi:hypothetical protein